MDILILIFVGVMLHKMYLWIIHNIYIEEYKVDMDSKGVPVKKKNGEYNGNNN